MITADRTSIIFNEITKEKPYEQTIYVTNHSDKEITINPWSSCGCTVASLKRNLLEPGATEILRVIYTPTVSGLDEKEFGVKFKINGQTYKLVITIIAKIL